MTELWRGPQRPLHLVLSDDRQSNSRPVAPQVAAFCNGSPSSALRGRWIGSPEGHWRAAECVERIASEGWIEERRLVRSLLGRR